MRNIILIRETLDWARASAADLRDDAIRERVALWDATFSVSYMECRVQIKAIAQEMLQQIKGVEIIGKDDVADLTLGHEDVLLIADDDDWYHPEVFFHLYSRGITDYQGAVWPDGLYGMHVNWDPGGGHSLELYVDAIKERPLEGEGAFSPIKTNNYALTGNYPGNIADVVSHKDATQALTLGNTVFLHVNQPLSLVNRHPCSYLVLVKAFPEELTAEQLTSLVESYISADIQDLTEDFAWARGAISQMQALFRSVLA